MRIAQASDICDLIDAVAVMDDSLRETPESERQTVRPLGEYGSVYLGGHQEVWRNFLDTRCLHTISSPARDPDVFHWVT